MSHGLYHFVWRYEGFFFFTQLFPGFPYSVPGFLFHVQYLAGSRESNLSCCDCSQVCYQWATDIPNFQIFIFSFILVLKIILTSRCQWHRWVRLDGISDTAESSSSMSVTQQSQAYQCHWHCRVLYVTAESVQVCHYLCTVAFKRIIRFKKTSTPKNLSLSPKRGKHLHTNL